MSDQSTVHTGNDGFQGLVSDEQTSSHLVEDVPADRQGAGGGATSEKMKRATPAWLRVGMARYALVLVWVLMAGYYWIREPSLFASHATFSSIFGSQQVQVFLAMSVLVTSVAGEIDLSVASVMGITATAIPVLATQHGVPLPLACIIGVAIAAVAGLVNAFFVVIMNVSSFVVTLGMGTLLIGVAQAISHTQVVSVQSTGLAKLSIQPIFGMPISFYYGIVLALLIAYVIAWTPIGRAIVFVGANREVARLAGIRVNRIRFASYVVGSLLAGLAGLILVATVGGFDSSTSMTFLLPALAAVFLGTAVIQPGSFNAIGTMVAIYFLETGIFGLQLLGYSGWIQNVFYGAGLVVAVALAKVIRDRSTKVA
ncbi:ABC transporter permease [Nocardioides sp. Iso805N]|uniref:ABC transporter permease n=1 Tax=Nocardioides sp. Iso805N TaxID=1283287 RepID=UPI00036B2D87|nr:ABC transporter permease [Nocardioides sp. Iso805N]